eukprot:5693442-Pyramimonas_sp.AAC.1
MELATARQGHGSLIHVCAPPICGAGLGPGPLEPWRGGAEGGSSRYVRPLWALAGPRGREKTTQDEKPVPGNGSTLLGVVVRNNSWRR